MARVQQKWCLGDFALPLTVRTLDFWDPQNLMEEESDSEDTPFLLLSLKVTGEAEWMERYLEKPSRWWRFKGRSQPLFQEILAAFPKKFKEGGGKEPRSQREDCIAHRGSGQKDPRAE